MAFSFISDLWNKWNIRAFVILSLLLQVTLILFAPLRKKIANRPIIFLLWLAYLMADSVAIFVVGLISQHQGNSNAGLAEVDGALQAFWSSFLLLHLGGPDTITAFSLEDNSLWQRHLLSLIFQVGAAIYIFVRIFLSDKSLVISTILVFLAGFIKIAERILALYLSSFPNLRKSMLSDNELSHLLEIGNVEEHGENLDESIVVQHAYSFFQIFKIFIVDLIYTKKQREMSMAYFRKVHAMDALRVISVELNFIYEELHTKALVIRHKLSYIFRIIAFTSIVVALVLFNRLKKHQLPELDVKITHILLFGGITLDGIALFNLVFSDWTVAKIKHTSTGLSKLDAFLNKLLSTTDYLRKPRYITCQVEPNTNVTYEFLHTPLIFKRWSESISACNIFSEALKESPRKVYKCNQFHKCNQLKESLRKIYKCNQLRGIIHFKNICSFPFEMIDKFISYFHKDGETIARCCGKRSMIANAKYVSKNPFMKKLWIFIFNEVKQSAAKSEGLKMVTLLVKSIQSVPRKTPRDVDDISEHAGKANMHNHIMVWHIATEICYNMDKQFMSFGIDSNIVDRMEFSKTLSDYMLYLLLNQPNLMSTVAMVGIAQMVSMETLYELHFLIRCEVPGHENLEGVCRSLYDTLRAEMPYPEGGPVDPLKSPLREGFVWARRLQHLGQRKWVEISDTWLMMLQYVAINIKGETHMQHLSKGGELLTFVWLLMAHLGVFFKPEWGMYREYWAESYRTNERGSIVGESSERGSPYERASIGGEFSV